MSSINKKHKLKLMFVTVSGRHLIIFAALVIVTLVGINYWQKKQSELIIPKLPKPPADSLYLQSNQPIDDRVDNLLSLMTVEEKIGQMALVDKNSLSSNTPEGWRTMIEEMKSTGQQSRLEIPILYGVDANHGHANVPGATVFPHAIGLGATNNLDLITQVATATSTELRATGVNWNFSPALDAPKDIRWGRVYEAFSDSPTLNGIYGAAYVDGTQKHQPGQSNVLASAKHFLGTGAMIWGQSNNRNFKIDQGRVDPDETKLHEEYLPPYKQVSDHQVASIMVALTDWGNGRIIEDKVLITDLLKSELQFQGFVVSDWYGVYEYARSSNYRANVNAINAGLDMAMLPYDYKSYIRNLKLVYLIRRLIMNQ
jgi:beta-glucosidase